MRLLQLRDGVLSLTQNFVGDVPPYAILSHTWGEDEQEVTLQDVMQGQGKGKEGYRKMEFCGNQAASDGLGYFWADTCCIDKPNYTELQESLNSMFRWYRNAAKCYVYLADVPRKSKTNDLHRGDWKSDLRASRWFRRGWTLQELLAPSKVEFFSSDGKKLGDKASLESLLSEITEIPVIALRKYHLSTFSVEERMLWIKNRQTKRAEDMAYSLFGIFDVQLPLLYGEGREKAFGRLQREIDNHDYHRKIVRKLPIAYGAAFDSHAEEHNATCLKGTRVELLSRISRWVDDPQTESLFWLNGMAGTGKSTISRTLASSYERAGRLGANFFFKKGEADRAGVSKFFTTLAAQLSRYIPATAQHIYSTLSADPAITEKSMSMQFEKLILQPLVASRSAIQQAASWLIILDALDECEVEEDVTLLIKIFSSIRRKAPGLKVFITSRPELPIRLGFNAIRGAFDKVILHDIAESVIKHDIAVFITHKLEQIRCSYNDSVEEEERKLPASWPTQQDIQVLVDMAAPLFIFAVTICLFIADRLHGNPRRSLRKILEYRTRAQGSKVDAMYSVVLEQLLAGLSDQESQEVLSQFRKVVGSIVVLANPLSPSALGRLLELPLEDVLDLLDFLHSVLNVPTSSKEPVTLLHLSFRDFLLDPKQSARNPFWIDQKKTHQQLAIDCFRTLKRSLRNDICGVHHPGTEHSAIDPEKIGTMLPDEVQYACEFWAYHLREPGVDILDDGEVHTFLSSHFLQWLEASSLLGRLDESVNAIRIVRNLMPAKASSQTARFLDDANRFILAFAAIIHQAPLQVYSSALIFTPQNNMIRLSFENQIPEWISLQPKIAPNWTSNLQTLEGHRDWVSWVVFSPDSKLVASSSWDKTIKLWATDSGALLQTLEGLKSSIRSLAFSPDGRTLASVSCNGIIQLWDVNTGALLQTRDIQVVTDSAAFSYNVELMVTGSGDKLVRIWVTNTGALQRTLEGHGDIVRSVTFLRDAELVAASSQNHKVLVWETGTGTLLKVISAFTGFSSSLRFLSFSPNSKLVASSSRNGIGDTTVQIWDTNMEVPLQTLHYHGRINSAAFSPDSKLIASASNDGIIQLRAADTGIVQQLFKGHRKNVLSVAFSPDGKLVASGSEDSTIRLWDVNIDAPVETRYDGSIISLSLSPDGRTVASTSDDHTVRLWDTYSGMLQRTLEGQSEHVLPVTFSLDGKIVASGSKDGTVRFWAVNTGSLKRTCKLENYDTLNPPVMQLTFSSDLKLVALASMPNILLVPNILLWDADTGGLLCCKGSHSPDNIDSLVFSPDSRFLASISRRATELYSTTPISAVESNSLVINRTLEGLNNRFPSAVFSPDGRLLASPSDDEAIRLWATDSGKLQHFLEGHGKTVNQITFSPDSEYVASASYDETVRLWETGTGMLHRVVDIGFRLTSLTFLTANKLQTDAGIITVDKSNPELVRAMAPILVCGRNNFSGCGLSSDGSWITLDGQNLIWLPPEFRPNSFGLQVLFDCMVVVGCNSGRTIVMRFSAEQFRRSGVVN